MGLEERARRHAALGDDVRLAIVDDLLASDLSPKEIAHRHGLASNLLAHHLDVLEEAGLVEAHMEPQPSRPARKVYHLTSEGRAVFLEWVRQPTPYLRHLRVEFLARLYFFRLLELDGLDGLVARQQAVCQAQIERFDRLAAETDDEVHRCVLEFRRGQLGAVVHWLGRCLEIL